MGFKLGEHIFDDCGLDPVAVGLTHYGQIVYYYIYERIIDMIRRLNDKVCG